MQPGQLPIPPATQDDPKSIELLRVWAAHGKQHVSLAAQVWDDPAAWGIMLVDLAKHLASAYQRSEGKEFEDALLRIRKGFDAEWDMATDTPSGEFVD